MIYGKEYIVFYEESELFATLEDIKSVFARFYNCMPMSLSVSLMMK